MRRELAKSIFSLFFTRCVSYGSLKFLWKCGFYLQLTTIVKAGIFSKACDHACDRKTISTADPWGRASYIGGIPYSFCPQNSSPHTLFQSSQKFAQDFLQVKVWITRFLLERPSDEASSAGMLCRLRLLDLRGGVDSASNFTGKLRSQNEL